MSAARRGAIAATVVLAGFVALLLSPASLRADSVTTTTTTTGSLSTQVVDASTTSTSTAKRSTTCVTPIIGTTTCSPLPTSPGTTSSVTSETTATTSASTLTYAVLPGNVSSIPPTATPRPPPTPNPSPVATTDTGLTALGTDTQATSEPTQATTVINPQPGGDSSSALPLTVLAFLVVLGGGAIFVITRLR